MRYWAVSMGGGVGKNLLTIVLVRRKMTHTSNKHQPNWLKFDKIQLLYHKPPKCVIKFKVFGFHGNRHQSNTAWL